MKKKFLNKKTIPVFSTLAALIIGAVVLKLIADAESNSRIKY